LINDSEKSPLTSHVDSDGPDSGITPVAKLLSFAISSTDGTQNFFTSMTAH
jgi:hypothetical protein